MNFFLKNIYLYNDAPEPWQISFQDSATTSMEGIDRLNGSIYYYEIIILTLIGWLFISIFLKFINNFITLKYNNHSHTLEIIWTCSPAVILFSIALPSFRLIYLTDEITEGDITLKVIGHQWYWSYEYPDYPYDISYDSFMIPTEDLELGQFRLLDVDNEIVIPGGITIKFICSSSDVLHSFAIPSAGIKIDSVPGRLNAVTTNFNRFGNFYGQCSELCGVFHLGMPIVLNVVPLENFLNWLTDFEENPEFIAYSPKEIPFSNISESQVYNITENTNLIEKETINIEENKNVNTLKKEKFINLIKKIINKFKLTPLTEKEEKEMVENMFKM